MQRAVMCQCIINLLATKHIIYIVCISLRSLVDVMTLTTQTWLKKQVHITTRHTNSCELKNMTISFLLSAENALKDAGLNYTAIEQAVVAYVYGTTRHIQCISQYTAFMYISNIH